MACANVAPDQDSETASLRNLTFGAVIEKEPSNPLLKKALSDAVAAVGGAPEGGPGHT